MKCCDSAESPTVMRGQASGRRRLGVAVLMLAAMSLGACARADAPLLEPRHSAVALTGGSNTSMIYLARTTDGVLAIDLGWWGYRGPLDRALDSLGAAANDIRWVFLTHSHRDHLAAWPDLRHARFHVGDGELPLLTGTAAHRAGPIRCAPISWRATHRAAWSTCFAACSFSVTPSPGHVGAALLRRSADSPTIREWRPRIWRVCGRDFRRARCGMRALHTHAARRSRRASWPTSREMNEYPQARRPSNDSSPASTRAPVSGNSGAVLSAICMAAKRAADDGTR